MSISELTCTRSDGSFTTCWPGGSGQTRRECALADLNTRAVKSPASVRTVVADVPEPLALVISRCLEPDPAAGFQTSEELEAESERLDDRAIEKLATAETVTTSSFAAPGVRTRTGSRAGSKLVKALAAFRQAIDLVPAPTAICAWRTCSPETPSVR